MHSNVKPCNPDFTACAIGFHPSPKPINKCPRDQALVNCFDYYVPFLLIIRFFCTDQFLCLMHILYCDWFRYSVLCNFHHNSFVLLKKGEVIVYTSIHGLDALTDVVIVR